MLKTIIEHDGVLLFRPRLFRPRRTRAQHQPPGDGTAAEFDEEHAARCREQPTGCVNGSAGVVLGGAGRCWVGWLMLVQRRSDASNMAERRLLHPIANKIGMPHCVYTPIFPIDLLMVPGSLEGVIK